MSFKTTISYIIILIQCKIMFPRAGPFLSQRHNYVEHFWQRITKWCYNLYTKHISSVVLDKTIVKYCILKTYICTLWPTYATTRTVWTIFVWDHQRIVLVKLGHNSTSGFRGGDVLVNMQTHIGRHTTPTTDKRPVPIAYHEHFVLRWAKQ